MSNLIIKNCCTRLHYAKYLTIIANELDNLLNVIYSKELYGDDTVNCQYDRINDFMHLQITLDNYLEEAINSELAPEYGEDGIPKDEILESFCIQKTYEYFYKNGFDIRPLLDLYDLTIPST